MIAYKSDTDSAVFQNDSTRDSSSLNMEGVEPRNRIAHLLGNVDTGKEVSIADRGSILSFVRPTLSRPSDILRGLASGLRGELSDFIETGIATPPSLMGFLAESSEPLNISDLKESLYEKSRTLEALFNNDRDQTPEGISIRSLAQGLQGALDSFRVFLTRQGFSGEIPRSHEGGVIEATIEFKQEVSQIIQKIDAFQLQLSMAAAGADEE